MAITKKVLQQRRHRLTILADFLEHTVLPMLDGAEFKMEQWGITQHNMPVPVRIDKTSECGFAGCAIGWGYYAPKLIKAGMRKDVFDNSWGSHTLNVRWTRAAEFFGITYPQFEYLFTPKDMSKLEGEAGLREVVRRIRIVAGGTGLRVVALNGGGPDPYGLRTYEVCTVDGEVNW